MFGNKKHCFKKQKKGILNVTRTKIKLTWHDYKSPTCFGTKSFMGLK